MDQTRFALGTFDAGAGPYPGAGGRRRRVRHPRRPALRHHRGAARRLGRRAARAGRGGGRARGGGAAGVARCASLPPVTPPGQIFGAGANYREHVIQMAVAHKLGTVGGERGGAGGRGGARDRRAPGARRALRVGRRPVGGQRRLRRRRPARRWDPTTTGSWSSASSSAGGPATCRSPTPSTHVAGYTICNDLTTRSLVPRTDIPMMGTDWLRAKNFPTFYPTGPWLVPARFVPDPLDLGIRLSLNGDDDAEEQHRGHDLRPGAAHLLHLPVRRAAARATWSSPARRPGTARTGAATCSPATSWSARSTAWACSAPAASRPPAESKGLRT